jgi:hypothetical protein
VRLWELAGRLTNGRKWRSCWNETSRPSFEVVALSGHGVQVSHGGIPAHLLLSAFIRNLQIAVSEFNPGHISSCCHAKRLNFWVFLLNGAAVDG